jgi:hypothetical protein
MLIDGLRVNLSDPGTDGWSRLTNPRTAADRRHRRLLWDDARAAKGQLSRSPAADVHIPIFDTDVRITRAEFEQRARPWLDRTVARTASSLSRSGVTPDRLAGVFLVGGSIRIPMVATLLHQRLGTAPTVIEQPELVVAQGSLNVAQDSLAAAPGSFAAAPEPSVDAVRAVARSAHDASPPQPPAIGTAAVPSRTPVESAPVSSAPASGDPVRVSSAPASADSEVRGRRARGACADFTDLVHRTPPRAGDCRCCLVLVLVAATWFVSRDRTPALTAQGEQNAAVFTSSQLRSFARRWLNDVRCAPESPNAGSIETVNCAARWSVNFRAYVDAATRAQIRAQRRTSYDLRGQQNLFGRGPRSGIRVDYVQENQYHVIYWDDEGPPVSGDLYSIELQLADLATVWNRYVR